MNLEDALNLGLRAYRVERIVRDGLVEFRATLPRYPQCTACGSTPAEAVRNVRHTLTGLRDRQAAVALTELEQERADRLRDAVRTLVTRALI